MRNLIWLRSDLRATDNTALYHASRDAGRDGTVIAVFIISPREWVAHHLAPVRISLMMRSLQALSNQLAKLNIPLIVETAPRAGDVPALLLKLARRHQCDAIYFNREYEVDEQRRDEQVRRSFEEAKLTVRAFTDQVVLAPDEVQKGPNADRGFYTVFTPYRKAWIARARRRGREVFEMHPSPNLQDPTGIEPSPIPAFEDLPLPRELLDRPRPDDVLWPAGEEAPQKRLASFVDDRIARYKTARDRPAEDGTSILSPYLAIGAISPRQCFSAALEANSSACEARIDKGRVGPVTWMTQLIWREFYIHVLAGFPRVCMGRAFQSHTDRLEWHYDEEALDRWKTGRTGYPIVDAGMRQLHATGWMHNRLRMITAMFLSKHLLIDWRYGEKHFMQHLVDGFFASNNGGWQWAASTGTDAVPYFRIFNAYTQSRKFDSGGDYIRKWVPELADLDADQIHQPLHDGLYADRLDYPEPIVDHARARARAIEAFKALRSRT